MTNAEIGGGRTTVGDEQMKETGRKTDRGEGPNIVVTIAEERAQRSGQDTMTIVGAITPPSETTIGGLVVVDGGT